MKTNHWSSLHVHVYSLRHLPFFIALRSNACKPYSMDAEAEF